MAHPCWSRSPALPAPRAGKVGNKGKNVKLSDRQNAASESAPSLPVAPSSSRVSTEIRKLMSFRKGSAQNGDQFLRISHQIFTSILPASTRQGPALLFLNTVPQQSAAAECKWQESWVLRGPSIGYAAWLETAAI